MTRSQRKDAEPPSQGPALDQARRVIKVRQEREARLPAPKNTRFGRYKPAAIEDAEDDKDAAMVMDADNITEEIPPVQYSVSDPPQRVRSANTDAPYDAGEAEKKAVNGRKLMTALNQDKVTGARQLVKSMMNSKVEVTIGNLLAGSGEARKLLFSAKEWETNESGPMNTEMKQTPLRMNSVHMRTSGENVAAQERSFFAPCPEVDITTPKGTSPALLDTGAEINVISLDMARKMKYVITRMDDIQLGIMSYKGDVDNFVGVVCDAPIEVQGVRNKTHIFVARSVDEQYCMILVRPWQIASEAAIWQLADGTCVCRLTDEETGKQVEFHAAEARFQGDQHKKMIQSLGRVLGAHSGGSLNTTAGKM
jgi:hypothetical protein